MRKALLFLLWLVVAGASIDLMIDDPASDSTGDVHKMDDPGDIPPSPKP